jgi:hypothetical protein
MAKKEDTMAEIEDALSLYNCVIDIDSIRSFKQGWNIYGDPEFRYETHDGRVVAFVGTFKSGKTWLIGRILNVPLKGDLAAPTPGLCMILSPGDLEKKRKKATEKNEVPQEVEEVKITDKKKALPPRGRGPPPPRIKTPTKLQNTYQEFCDIIPLDTAGTDRPTFSNCSPFNI